MTPQAYLYVCDGDIDSPVLTHKKMDWPEKYPHWQEIPLVMAQQAEPVAWSHAGAMPPEQEEMKEAAYQLAPWLSAALDDPKVCKEYKDVINAWFDAAMPTSPRQPLTDEEIDELSRTMVKGNKSVNWLARAIEAKLKEKNA